MDTNNEPTNFSEGPPQEPLKQEKKSEVKSVEQVVGSIVTEKITMNKIIEKIVPIVGAIFLIIGSGYLIYTNAWINLSMVSRLGLGFFLSIAIIGGSFSMAEKLRYFTDIGIGSGVLLLYATLIYGSRTTDLAAAVIPEVATLATAFLFIIAVSYFASKRNSKVIILLGMVGAYITPFVIGQNDVWAQNISFNAFLIYFTAINVAVYLLGREISVRNIIPLNIIGLFIGTSTLYNLSYSSGVTKLAQDNFFSGEIFTAILFLVLVVFLTWSILLSAREFNEKDDGYLALGYMAPVIWFAYNIRELSSLTNVAEGALFALIAASCFAGWHVLRGEKTRFQHLGLYAAGLFSAVLAFFAFVPELDIYSSIAIAYLSLIFGGIYAFNPEKVERLISYGIVNFMGSFLSLVYILDNSVIDYRTLYVVIALVPAMCGHFIAKQGGKNEYIYPAKVYSFTAFIIALMFVFAEFLDYIDLGFLLFYVGPLIVLGHIFFFNKRSADQGAHDFKSDILRVTLIWFGLGFVSIFLKLIFSIYPAPSDIYLFTHTELPTDWIMIKGVFATVILFFGLTISRRLQIEQVEKRPSFLLVIFGFMTLILTGNYIIYAIMNDFSVSMAIGGPRAIATTIWWVAVAIYMLIVGMKMGKKYHSEKLLGLILLAITVGKILLYDVSMMGMQNKVLILMVVGVILLLFSYGVHTKGLLKDKDEEEEKQPPQ